MKVIILGSGLVGGPMAADLALDKRFQVSVADINPLSLEKAAKLHPAITTLTHDLSDPLFVQKLVADYDMVINAVPGFMGYRTLEAVIKAGKPVVDIAFFPEDPFGLDVLAKENNVVAIMDCGVAPGMSNILIGYVDHIMDETLSGEIYVGGLPVVREWPYEYKAVFSPADVVEEYTRPARYVRDGKEIVKEALTEPELMNFEGVGTLEAFNSDGLRSLIYTIKSPNLIEKTMRYPGHIEIMRILRETGFFDKKPINLNGTDISPLDFTSKLLFPAWEMKKDDRDLTVMRVIVEGIKSGIKQRYEYNLLDFYDEETQVHSMARTTGYTATVALRMIMEGVYSQTGITVPEYLGKHPKCVEYLLKGLKEKGIEYKLRIS